MGPLCEEHVPKSDASIWSCEPFKYFRLILIILSLFFLALIPVHTRVLFDILQEAYREKAYGRSRPRPNHNQVDLSSSLTTHAPSSSFPYKTTAKTKTTKVKSNPTTRRRQTTTIENVIQTDRIPVKHIFSKTSTLSSSDVSTQSFTTITSPTFETTEQVDDETTIPTDIIETTENAFTSLSPLTTMEDMMTLSAEQNQTDYSNNTEDQDSFPTTEQYNLTIASESNEWSNYYSDNEAFDNTTELTENSTVQISNNTESDDFIDNTTFQTINETSFEPIDDSSNQTDYNLLNTSESTTTSILTSINPTLSAKKSFDLLDSSKDAQHQLLLKLCQQLLSQIHPNATSLSTSAAIEAALALSSGSSSSDKNSSDALLIWIQEQLSSTTTTAATTTTPITMTTTTIPTTRRKTTSSTTRTTLSPSLPALLINEKKISSISLQRVHMDDILHQMNNNNDGEN